MEQHSLVAPQQGPYLSISARTSTTRVEDMDTEQQQQPALEVVEPAPAEVLEPEQPQEEAPPAIPQTPQTSLTFLLVSGRRRTMAFDPDTTVGRVKELVWNAWPSEPEWQAERPPAPAYLRILYLGKILQDEDTLAKLSFPSHTPPSPSASPKPAPPPTIVHLSIRAYAPPADDALKKKKSARRRGNTTSASAADGAPGAEGGAEEEEAGGCCCVVC